MAAPSETGTSAAGAADGMATMAAEPDLGGRALAALGWNYGGALARVLLQLGVQLLLARLLGPAAFGEATAALIVLGVGWLFAEGGFGTALIQKATIDDGDVAFALGWILLLSGSLGVLVMLVAPWLARGLGAPSIAPLVLACGAMIPLQSVSNLPISLMQRALDMKRLQIIQNLSYLVGYGGVGVGLAASGGGAWSLLGAFAAQVSLSLVATYACVRHTLRPKLIGDPALRRFGLTISATNLVNWSLDNVDRLMISRLWGPLALGEYAVAANLSRAPVNLMVSSAQSVTFSSASRLQNDHERLLRGYLGGLCLVFLLVAPTFAYLGWHAEGVVALLYGQQWRGAGPLFAIFCAAVPFVAVLAITGPVLRALAAVQAEFGIHFAILAVMVVGLYLLRDHPLHHVAWLIPVLAAARVVMACITLSRRIGLRVTDLAHSLAAGAVCAGLSVAVSVGLQAVGAGAGAPLLAIPLTLVACWLTVRVSAGRLLGPALRRVLLGRAATSGGLARLCRWLGLRESR